MPFFKLENEESKFIKDLIKLVVPQNLKREEMKEFLSLGDSITEKLNKPIEHKKETKTITSPKEFEEKIE